MPSNGQPPVPTSPSSAALAFQAKQKQGKKDKKRARTGGKESGKKYVIKKVRVKVPTYTVPEPPREDMPRTNPTFMKNFFTGVGPWKLPKFDSFPRKEARATRWEVLHKQCHWKYPQFDPDNMLEFWKQASPGDFARALHGNRRYGLEFDDPTDKKFNVPTTTFHVVRKGKQSTSLTGKPQTALDCDYRSRLANLGKKAVEEAQKAHYEKTGVETVACWAKGSFNGFCSRPCFETDGQEVPLCCKWCIEAGYHPSNCLVSLVLVHHYQPDKTLVPDMKGPTRLAAEHKYVFPHPRCCVSFAVNHHSNPKKDLREDECTKIPLDIDMITGSTLDHLKHELLHGDFNKGFKSEKGVWPIVGGLDEKHHKTDDRSYMYFPLEKPKVVPKGKGKAKTSNETAKKLLGDIPEEDSIAVYLRLAFIVMSNLGLCEEMCPYLPDWDPECTDPEKAREAAKKGSSPNHVQAAMVPLSVTAARGPPTADSTLRKQLLWKPNPRFHLFLNELSIVLKGANMALPQDLEEQLKAALAERTADQMGHRDHTGLFLETVISIYKEASPFYKATPTSQSALQRPMSLLATLVGGECRQVYMKHPLNTKYIHHGECIVFDGAVVHGGKTKTKDEVELKDENGQLMRRVYDAALHGHIDSAVTTEQLKRVPGKLCYFGLDKLEGAHMPGELSMNMENKIECRTCHDTKAKEVFRDTVTALLPDCDTLKKSSGIFQAKVMMEHVACVPETVLIGGHANMGPMEEGTALAPAMIKLCTGALNLAAENAKEGKHTTKSKKQLEYLELAVAKLGEVDLEMSADPKCHQVDKEKVKALKVEAVKDDANADIDHDFRSQPLYITEHKEVVEEAGDDSDTGDYMEVEVEVECDGEEEDSEEEDFDGGVRVDANGMELGTL